MAEAPAPLRTPVSSPLPGSVPAERPALTEEQSTKYDWLLARVRSWSTVPSAASSRQHHHHFLHIFDNKDSTSKHEDAGATPLTDRDRLWLTRECLIRYLRATKWHKEESHRRLLDTLVWRRDYGVSPDAGEGGKLTPEHISPENETGKQILVGFDKQCRPCHYLNPGRQNTDPSPRQVQHLVFMVERVVELMPAGVENLSLMINFKQSKNRSNTAPGIGLAREVLNILQMHYPERLGRALIINVPWIVSGFFKLITPFIDPVTRPKLKFNEDMTQYVAKEQLWTEWPGGELGFEYEHGEYWPALVQLCKERREERMRRWVEGGKHVGELEEYLAGGREVGVAGEMPKDGEVGEKTKGVQDGVEAAKAEATGTEEGTKAVGEAKAAKEEEKEAVKTGDEGQNGAVKA